MDLNCYNHELEAYKLDIRGRFYGSVKRMIEAKLLINVLLQANLFIWI